MAVGEEEDETKKKEERARLLKLVERTLKEIEETREALLAEIAGRAKR